MHKEMRVINLVVVHCSATREGQNISTENIREWHTKERGWSDIGYHYVIELDGKIVEGRPISVQGAHARGYNEYSVGVCYVGGVDKDLKAKDTRTPQQKRSLQLLLEQLNKLYNVEVIGHRDVSPKECPSFDAKKEYKYISLMKC